MPTSKWFCAQFFFVLLTANSLLAANLFQQQAQDAVPQEQESFSPRQHILDDAFDFSSEPVLPSIDAPSPESVQAAIDRGVEYILENQNSDGSWGTPDAQRPFQIYAPIPGAHDAFRSAVTALCISALIETTSTNERSLSAIAKGENWLTENISHVKRATGDAIYNVWSHAYSIQAFVRLHQRAEGNAQRQAELKTLIEKQMEMLDNYESVDGGWGYYDFRYQARKPTSSSTSFVNATVLIALWEAKQIGIDADAKTVSRAVDATRRQQKPDFTYMYGEYLKDRPMSGINRPAGSLGRSQACNVAMRRWGDEKVTDLVLKNWLYRLFVRNGWLSIGRKRPIPHEAWFQVAGYFYYYGHYYAAFAIDEIQPAERGPYQDHLAKIIMPYQEPDGSWWDYPMYGYHKPYGTAFAIMTLRRCQRDATKNVSKVSVAGDFNETTQDWMQFRGEAGAGRAPLGESFPSQLDLDKSLAWKTTVPEGHSSPSIVGNKIFLTGFEPGKLSVFAIDRNNGQQLWKKDYPVEQLERFYHHGPATPTIVSDGTHLYVVFGSLGVFALDLNGEEIWKHTWTIPKNLYGVAASPILVDEKLIVINSDQEKAKVWALNKLNGEIIWERTAEGPASTWATPVVLQRPEEDLLLVYEPFNLRALSLAEGKEVWSIPNLADEPITLPQLVGDLVIVTSFNMRTNSEIIGVPKFEEVLKICDDNGDQQLNAEECKKNVSVLSRPDSDGEGDHPLRAYFRMLDENNDGQIDATEWPKMQAWLDEFQHLNGFIALKLRGAGETPTMQWKSESGVPECPTPVCVDGLLFAVRNGGVMTCVNTKNGEMLWQDRVLPGGPYYASPVWADKKVYFASARRGEVTVTTAEAKPKVLSTVDLGEPVWATPALSEGALIVRSKTTLWMFKNATAYEKQ